MLRLTSLVLLVNCEVQGIAAERLDLYAIWTYMQTNGCVADANGRA